MVVSARKNQHLYVLTKDNFWWLSTLATSRKGCWDYVAKKTQTTKARLKFEGLQVRPCETGRDPMIFIHHHGDSEREEIASGDICDECGRDFGFSGDDGNGAYNSRCVHCGSTYYTSKEEEDECQPLKSGR